jgi:hypothetical protein
MENSSRVSCQGGFILSFREEMRGFHDLLKQKPSTVFILLDKAQSHVTFLLMWSIYCSLMERVVVLWSRM